MSAPPSRPLVFKSSPVTCWSFCQALGWAGQTPTCRKGTAPCQRLVLAVKAGSHKSGKASLRQRNRGCERQAWEAAGGTAGQRGPRCPSLLPTPAPGTFSSGLSASPTSHPLSSFLPGAKYLRALRCPEGRHLMPLCPSDATGSERAPRHLVPPPHQPPRPSKPASSGCCCSLRTLPADAPRLSQSTTNGDPAAR